MNLSIPSTITKINSHLLHEKEIELFIKRDDLIHEIISGNKWRKLKYNFKEASHKGLNTILSFGGAYSNHLHALSYACNKMGFDSVGVVRGDEPNILNSTLSDCEKNKMKLNICGTEYELSDNHFDISFQFPNSFVKELRLN